MQADVGEPGPLVQATGGPGHVDRDPDLVRPQCGERMVDRLGSFGRRHGTPNPVSAGLAGQRCADVGVRVGGPRAIGNVGPVLRSPPPPGATGIGHLR